MLGAQATGGRGRGSLIETRVSSGRAGRGPSARTWWLIAIGFAAGYAGLLVVGGEASDLAVAGLETLPFIILALLAYGGLRSTALRALAWIWLAVLTLGAALVAFSSLNDALPPAAQLGAEEPAPELWVAAVWIALGLVAGWACALPPIRAHLARLIPIDPDSYIHAIALVVVVSVTIVFTVPVAVLGEPPLLAQLARDGAGPIEGDSRDDVYRLLWLIPAAMLAVGWPLVREWRGALARLGLVRPTLRQVGLALCAGAAMVILFGLLDYLIAGAWEALNWPATDEETFEELIAYTLTPVGALVIGVTAGLGEELGVRGVLQPRLGVWLSNLFFAALHALQYNFDAILSVFLAGLVFGLIRRKTNTTTSAIVHGFYDFLLIMLTVLSLPGF
jgi:membrane protease YdiL (CAAX protease family)